MRPWRSFSNSCTHQLRRPLLFKSQNRPERIRSIYVDQGALWSTFNYRCGLRCAPFSPLAVYKRQLSSEATSQDGDTIYALSTPPGRGAIAIIRISGPACVEIYRRLCPSRPLPKPRYATLRTLYDPRDASDGSQNAPSILDSGALVLYFPAPSTVTGEDVLELHVHGGPAIVKAVLRAISTVNSSHVVESLLGAAARPKSSVRYAEPGEFTRRAFYNNRLDLTQIEALGDSLSAETEQQRRLAIRGNSNTQAQRYESWRHELRYARGEMEALIDFAEDQDFEESPAKMCASIKERVQHLEHLLLDFIENAAKGELLRNGIDIALIGSPNAGKSSLLNRIVGREAAIVSQEPGTTRDVVDVSVDFRGYLCRFGDLAGLRKAGDSPPMLVGDIEREGMKRAKERAMNADVVLVVVGAETKAGTSEVVAELDPEISEVLKHLDFKSQKIVIVLNKMDIFDGKSKVHQACMALFNANAHLFSMEGVYRAVFPISCKNALETPTTAGKDNDGIQTLLHGLTDLFRTMTTPSDHSCTPPPLQYPQQSQDRSMYEESLGATERQRLLLQQCQRHLQDFLSQVQNPDTQLDSGMDSDAGIGQNPEVRSLKEMHAANLNPEVDVVLATESLRSAADCLARITGRTGAGVGDVEEVLGVVFEK